MKLIGLCIIFLSCSATGFIRSHKYIRPCEELYSFIMLIKHIRHEVSTHLARQRDILESFEDEVLEKNSFLKILRREEITDEKSPLFHALEKGEGILSISGDVKRILAEFSENLGQLSPDEQCSKCDAVTELLEEIYKKEKEEAHIRSRLSRSIGCMAGVGIVLLLL